MIFPHLWLSIWVHFHGVNGKTPRENDMLPLPELHEDRCLNCSQWQDFDLVVAVIFFVVFMTAVLLGLFPV